MRVTQWCQPAQVILFDEGGFLYARAPEDNIDLQGLLTQALQRFGGQGAGGSTMVQRSAALPPLVLHVNPVGRQERAETLLEAAVRPVPQLQAEPKGRSEENSPERLAPIDRNSP